MTIQPLNIMLVTIDTLRPDHLGCYGYSKPTSPHIDRLAQEGVLFQQAITGGSYTLSAFPVILSSTYASMYGGCKGRLADERPMLAEVLHKAGVRTAGITSNPLVGKPAGYDRGFDTFVELMPPRQQPSWHQIKGVQRLLRQPRVQTVLSLLHIEGKPLPVYVSGDEVTDQTCRRLDEAGEGFFLWAHYMDTHWPYHLENRLNSNAEIAQAWRDGAVMHRAFRHKVYPGDEQMRRVIELYDMAVQYVDEQVGRLTEKLIQLGVYDQTLIIVTSDHGEAFFDHERFMHGAYYDLYDEVLKVPLIIRFPGGTIKPQTVKQQVRLLDLAPTILDLLRLPRPSRMEGVSLLPTISGSSDPDYPDHCISEMWDFMEGWSAPWHCIAIRTEAYKYMYDNKRPDTYELYDLQADPGEKHNLRGERPEIAERFQAVLQDHLNRVEASQTRPLSEEEEITRRLRGLGYID